MIDLAAFDRIAVIGLGYVGLPLAVALSAHRFVLGFDVDARRISELQRGIDRSKETDAVTLITNARLRFTTEPAELAGCSTFIIAVPTPVNSARLPDLGPLLSATRTVAQRMKKGALVIYESTVYPGATEDECVPVIERVSGLRFNTDFFVGYSPERINPGDRARGIANIVKVTSGSTPEAATAVDALYRSIVPAGTHLAPSIRVAEAAKAVENTQRDINIAFANELAMIFNRMDLDIQDVLDAASTKWNFMPVRPGLVGGHCIGIDPYYLIHKAREVGAHPRLIEAAREINESMPEFVLGRMMMIAHARNQNLGALQILVLGITFKENCSDIRNSGAVLVIKALERLGVSVAVHDPVADAEVVLAECGIKLTPLTTTRTFDAAILAVSHKEFLTDQQRIQDLLGRDGWMLDIKGALPRAANRYGLAR